MSALEQGWIKEAPVQLAARTAGQEKPFFRWGDGRPGGAREQIASASIDILKTNDIILARVRPNLHLD